MLSVQLLTQINAEAHALMSTLSQWFADIRHITGNTILNLFELDCCSLQDKKAKTCHLSVINCFHMKKIIVVFPVSVLSEAKHLFFFLLSREYNPQFPHLKMTVSAPFPADHLLILQ